MTTPAPAVEVIHFAPRDPLSPHAPRKFVIRDVTFTSLMQFITFCHAKLLKEEAIAAALLADADPTSVTTLQRTLEATPNDAWEVKRIGWAEVGLRACLAIDPSMRHILRATGNHVLAYAHPGDRVWGSGLWPTDTKIYDLRKWIGLNLLGSALMAVRQELPQVEGHSSDEDADASFRRALECGLVEGSIYVEARPNSLDLCHD